MFNEEGRDEARRFIDILTKTLAADPRTMAILVMRSDAFPLVQSDPALAALPKDTFTLDMMLEGSFRAVIEGPARWSSRRSRSTRSSPTPCSRIFRGRTPCRCSPLRCAHLYDNYRADNELTLAGYDKIGRVRA